MVMMRMRMMMSVLLADANERISAGSLRIGTGVNVFLKTLQHPVHFSRFSRAVE